MSNFVYLFRATEAGSREAMGTPERAQRSMQDWLAWIHELEANGHLKDRGQPLERTGAVVRGGPDRAGPDRTGPDRAGPDRAGPDRAGIDRAVTDGPYAETKDLVLGFIVIEARDLAQAIDLAAGCPIAKGGGSVEVRPVMTLPMP